MKISVIILTTIITLLLFCGCSSNTVITTTNQSFLIYTYSPIPNETPRRITDFGNFTSYTYCFNSDNIPLAYLSYQNVWRQNCNCNESKYITY